MNREVMSKPGKRTGISTESKNWKERRKIIRIDWRLCRSIPKTGTNLPPKNRRLRLTRIIITSNTPSIQKSRDIWTKTAPLLSPPS
jgi:hypothetical protein